MHNLLITINISAILFFITVVPHAQSPQNLKISSDQYFTNPIFQGDYPDPSLLVDGDDFYVVHSSFEYYPGLTIWHSRDLVNWIPVTSALNKYVGSVWAPDLVKHNDKYYIYFPAKNTNFVVVADSINGPWSDPIDLKIGNIDPGHIADDKGKRYLFFSNGGYVPLSQDGLSVAGDLQTSYDGWPIPNEWTIECFCLEGPKIFRKGGYYYITVAEGGTAGPPTGHMVISARSKSLVGPWENSPYNPILRSTDNIDKWASVGHATISEIETDNWWMIFHGYENGHYNLGRQTLLAPVKWTDDHWFKISDELEIDKPIKLPIETRKKVTEPVTNTFDNQLWKFFGEFDTSRFQIRGKKIEIIAKGNSIGESSPLLSMPSNHSYIAQVELEIEGDATGGLVLFYNTQAYSGILADHSNILTNLRGWQFPVETNAIDKHVSLRLKNVNDIVDMFYSLDGKSWRKIESSLEVSSYHHNVLGGFLSLRIGLVSVGNGKVKFENFKYQAID